MRRSFNKTSTGRGCLLSESSAPMVPGFVLDNRRLSLVLGNEPGDGIDGFVLRYPEAAADRVLALVNRREGTDYISTAIRVTLHNGQQVAATTWKTNTKCASYLGDLPIGDAAAILAHATPDQPGARARGVAYLEQLRVALAGAGLQDDYLDRLSLAIKALT